MRSLTLPSTAVLALALVGLAAPAHADTWRERDSRHDVHQYTLQLDSKCDTFDVGPTLPKDTRRDVLALAVDHSTDTVTVRLQMAKVLGQDEQTSFELVLKTPQRLYSIDSYLDPKAGLQVDIEPVHVTHDPECGNAVFTTGSQNACLDLAVDTDRKKDVVTFTVPRTCIADPTWVRVGASAGGLDFDQVGPHTTSIDIQADSWGGRVADLDNPVPPLSPKVRVG